MTTQQFRYKLVALGVLTVTVSGLSAGCVSEGGRAVEFDRYPECRQPVERLSPSVQWRDETKGNDRYGTFMQSEDPYCG